MYFIFLFSILDLGIRIFLKSEYYYFTDEKCGANLRNLCRVEVNYAFKKYNQKKAFFLFKILKRKKAL